jgi:hypothetical protein
MGQQTEVKKILLSFLEEIRDLRSTQTLLCDRVSPRIRIGDARDAKFQMTGKLDKIYGALRKQIEELP